MPLLADNRPGPADLLNLAETRRGDVEKRLARAADGQFERGGGALTLAAVSQHGFQTVGGHQFAEQVLGAVQELAAMRVSTLPNERRF